MELTPSPASAGLPLSKRYILANPVFRPSQRLFDIRAVTRRRTCLRCCTVLYLARSYPFYRIPTAAAHFRTVHVGKLTFRLFRLGKQPVWPVLSLVVSLAGIGTLCGTRPFLIFVARYHVVKAKL